MNGEAQDRKMSQLIAKCWADEDFKMRLLANPAAVLKEYGLEIPPGLQVKIVEDTPQVCHLTLPPKPTADELSEEELERVAGGFCCGACYCKGKSSWNRNSLPAGTDIIVDAH